MRYDRRRYRDAFLAAPVSSGEMTKAMRGIHRRYALYWHAAPNMLHEVRQIMPARYNVCSSADNGIMPKRFEMPSRERRRSI